MKSPIDYRLFGYHPGPLLNLRPAVLEQGVASIGRARQSSDATIGYPDWRLNLES